MNYSKSLWEKTVADFQKLFNFSAEEITRFKNSKVGYLIASIPYIADCPNAEALSYAHLASYVVAVKLPNVGAMRKGQTIDDRLSPIHNFPGGNKDAVKKGMKLLALLSLEDHYQDRENDKKKGRYNPINNNDIVYEKEKTKLMKEINAIKNYSFDIDVSTEKYIKAERRWDW